MRYIQLVLYITFFVLTSCSDDDTAVAPDEDADEPIVMKSYDSSLAAPFGALDYRVYYPEKRTEETFAVHVSRGGNGIGDDRGALIEYVEGYVQEGYVVVQVDHRFGGRDIERIAQLRGEEIQFIGQQVAQGTLDYGDFRGRIDGSVQGFAGHSGGCMEGLMAAGTEMDHGNYHVPQIKAVYGMSPAGYEPDQFGITQTPRSGYSQIGETAVFVIMGEEEVAINGPGTFMAEDWRLQAFSAMNSAGPRFQALVKGSNTDHIDIRGENTQIKRYNIANSLALFDVHLRGENRGADIGKLALPDTNDIELRKK